MFFLRAFSRLPFWFLYRVSDGLFFLSFYVLRYRRKIVWRNLTRSFPEKSVDELQSIQKEFYKNLCDYVVETVKLLSLTKEELSERMKFVDVKEVQEYANQNQSLIALASHQFNWEWLVAAGPLNYPMPIDFVYQKQSSRLADQFSAAVRSKFGAFSIARDNVAREAIRRKDILRCIAIVADQYPGHGNDKKYNTTFLNQHTVFFHGIGSLAVLMQYPVVFVNIQKVKRGFYEVRFPVIARPPYSKDNEHVMEQYVQHTEQLIKNYPSSWLWSHNRWKNRHLK